jgi:hypothetical protein
VCSLESCRGLYVQVALSEHENNTPFKLDELRLEHDASTCNMSGCLEISFEKLNIVRSIFTLCLVSHCKWHRSHPHTPAFLSYSGKNVFISEIL